MEDLSFDIECIIYYSGAHFWYFLQKITTNVHMIRIRRGMRGVMFLMNFDQKYKEYPL